MPEPVAPETPPQAETPAVPPSPTPQEQLQASYELPDTEPADIAPAPAAPAAPAAAEPAKAPKYLVDMAIDQGFTQAEIDAIAPEVLGSILRRNQTQILEMARQQAAARTLQGDNPKTVVPAAPVEEEDLLAGEYEEDGEDGQKTLRKLTSKDFHKAFGGAFKKLQDKIKALEAQTGTLVRREAESNTEILDRCFTALPEVFGADGVAEIKSGSPEHVRRLTVLQIVQADKSHRSLEQKTKKAIETLYGKAAPTTPAASPKPATPAPAAPAVKPPVAPEEWNGAATARPTHRGGAAEPKGRARAIAAVEARLKESVLASAETNGEETTLDEFPD